MEPKQKNRNNCGEKHGHWSRINLRQVAKLHHNRSVSRKFMSLTYLLNLINKFDFWVHMQCKIGVSSTKNYNLHQEIPSDRQRWHSILLVLKRSRLQHGFQFKFYRTPCTNLIFMLWLTYCLIWLVLNNDNKYHKNKKKVLSINSKLKTTRDIIICRVFAH